MKLWKGLLIAGMALLLFLVLQGPYGYLKYQLLNTEKSAEIVKVDTKRTMGKRKNRRTVYSYEYKFYDDNTLYFNQTSYIGIMYNVGDIITIRYNDNAPQKSLALCEVQNAINSMISILIVASIALIMTFTRGNRKIKV